MTNSTTSTTAAMAASAMLGVALFAYHRGKQCGRSECTPRGTQIDISLKTASSENDGCNSHVMDAVNRTVKSNDSTTISCLDKAGSAESNDKAVSNGDNFDMLPIYPIGSLRSIYRLCVGTPRQVRCKRRRDDVHSF